MTNLRRAMIAVAALCMLPMAAVLVSAVLAALLNCELNEGGATACIVLGVDFGGFLSGLFTLGWMALLTLPLLMGVLVLWGAIEAISVWRRRRMARKAERAQMQEA